MGGLLLVDVAHGRYSHPFPTLPCGVIDSLYMQLIVNIILML